MRIKTLVENTAVSEAFGSEHGLSLYIETKKRKLLFDVGESDLFLNNARKMGVNIAGVDAVVISHGHCDHGGGLRAFFSENKKAQIFTHREAFLPHYSRKSDGALEFIGLDQEHCSDKRILATDKRFFFGYGLELFAGVEGNWPRPSANTALYEERDGAIAQDRFSHEQNLIVSEGRKMVLFAGCAHNGIVNILRRFFMIKGRFPDAVIGGFHLHRPSTGQGEPTEAVLRIGEYLKDTQAKYYTGHCTGNEAYCLLKDILGEQLQPLPTGSDFTL